MVDKKAELKKTIVNGLHVTYHITAFSIVYKSGGLDLCISYLSDKLSSMFNTTLLSSETSIGILISTVIAIMISMIVKVDMNDMEEEMELEEDEYVYEDELEKHHIRRKR